MHCLQRLSLVHLDGTQLLATPGTSTAAVALRVCIHVGALHMLACLPPPTHHPTVCVCAIRHLFWRLSLVLPPYTGHVPLCTHSHGRGAPCKTHTACLGRPSLYTFPPLYFTCPLPTQQQLQRGWGCACRRCSCTRNPIPQHRLVALCVQHTTLRTGSRSGFALGLFELRICFMGCCSRDL